MFVIKFNAINKISLREVGTNFLLSKLTTFVPPLVNPRNLIRAAQSSKARAKRLGFAKMKKSRRKIMQCYLLALQPV